MDHIAQRKQRWNDFYDRNTGDETQVLFQIQYSAPYLAPPPLLHPGFKQERIEFAWRRYLEQLERSTWLEDDTIPNFLLMSGAVIFSESLGSTPYYSPASYWPSPQPIIFSPEDVKKFQIPRLEDTSLMLYFEMADELQARGGKDILFNLPDMQCPMDILAQLWDKNDLYVSMVDEPELVRELAIKIRTFFCEFMDEWFRRYGTEFIAHHPSYYMNGGISVTVDEIGTISADMYRQFFEEDLHFLSQRYGGIGIHCCANSRHQWENLSKTPGLRMLNLYRPEKVLEESYTYFRDITCMWPGKMEGGVPEPMVNPKKADLPRGCRLVLTENASSRDEALRLAERMHREYR